MVSKRGYSPLAMRVSRDDSLNEPDRVSPRRDDVPEEEQRRIIEEQILNHDRMGRTTTPEEDEDYIPKLYD